MTANNPYAAPTASPQQRPPGLPPKWHRWAWLVPLLGMAISVILNAMANSQDDTGRDLGMVGGFIFIGCVLAGWIVTIALVFSLITRRGGWGHFIGGVITNGFLTLVIVVTIHAASLARQAARQHEQRQQMQSNLNELQDAIDKYKTHGPQPNGQYAN